MTRTTPTPETRAHKRAAYFTGLLWHTGTFVIINAFFWILDAWGAGGVNWSIWITVFWGFALAFHALAYLVDGRQMEDRKAREFVEEERIRDALLR